jgi:hypothetical protein
MGSGSRFKSGDQSAEEPARSAQAWGEPGRRERMPGIVEFPDIVLQAVDDLGDVFDNERARRHFAEYLTGLYVADSKTVSGINREFARTTDQSCLNRWITQGTWDAEELNEARLDWLQQDPSTQFSRRGVIAIDDTLIDHDGKLIQDVGYFWDHAEERHKIAHDYLIAGYVTTAGKQFPLEFKRFRKREQCEAMLEHLEARPGGVTAADPRELEYAEFKSHTQLCIELIDWVVQHEIPGDFAWDSYFSNAQIMNHAQSRCRGYVGDLKFNRKLWVRGREWKGAEYADYVTPGMRRPIALDGRRQWYFTVTCRLPEVDHKVRIAILWKHKNDKRPVKLLVTNRIIWEPTRVLSVYRQRWTGTETFHRDGKQHLGMGDCQLRSGEGQTRHMYLVFVAHSLLMRELRQGHAYDWALARLTTIGEACRSVLKETIGKSVAWAVRCTLELGWNEEETLQKLALR